MAKRMLIDASRPEEQRVVVLDGEQLMEADFDSNAKTQIKGNLYLARITRVEPSLQAAFVDFGNNKHGFLPFSEIHPDYFQIPVADREALMADVQAALTRRQEEQAAEEAAAEARAQEPEAEDTGEDAGEAQDDSADVSDQAGAEEKPKRAPRKTKAQKEAEAAAEAADAADDSADAGTEASTEAPKPKRAPRKTKAQKEAEAAADAAGDSAEAGAEASTEAPKPKRAPRKTKAQKEAEAAAKAADAGGDSAEAGTEASTEAPKPKRAPRKTKAQKEAEEAAKAADAAGDTAEASEEKPKRRSPRKRAVEMAVENEVVFAEAADASDASSDAPTDGEAASSPRRGNRGRRRATPASKLKSSDGENREESRNDAKANTAGEGRGRGRGRGRGGNSRNEARNSNVRGPSRGQRSQSDEVEELSDEEFQTRRMARAILQKKYPIQDVIKRGQVVLVQAAKEERGDKGAALTTFVSLPGRYCVFMPNTYKAGGVSRRIQSAGDRKRLRGILDGLNMSQSTSLIVRTAGAERTQAEIERDYDYLSSTWNEIRETTLNSFAPALVYEEANILKRAIRDVYEGDTQEVLVEGDAAFDVAQGFMQTLTPSDVDKVKLYDGNAPLFQAYGVEGMLETLHQPTVALPSGGYLVFNQTEALVAVDVNSGKATGERNIEETATRTNLEAARETARQLRLRDLAGLVVIDFIDMEDNRNIAAVEKALREAVTPDRARIQLGRISQFGLMEMSRQRLRPSVAEATMAICPTCQGSGFTRSNDANVRAMIRLVEQSLTENSADGVKIFAGPEFVMYLANEARADLARLEQIYAVRIDIEIDPQIGPSHYRCVVERDGRFETFGTEQSPAQANKGKGKGRNRGGRGRNRDRSREHDEGDTPPAAEQPSAPEASSDEDGEPKSRRRGKRGGRRRGRKDEGSEQAQTSAIEVVGEPGAEPSAEASTEVTASVEAEEEQQPKKRTRRPRKKPAAEAEEAPAEVAVTAEVATPAKAEAPAEVATPAEVRPPVEVTVAEETPAQAEPKTEAPKRKGWWNLGRG